MTTQVRPSAHDRAVTTHAPIVVGVDGSERSHAAVLWASHEAQDTDQKLVLVGAAHEYATPMAGFAADFKSGYFVDETRRMLETVRRQLVAAELGDVLIQVRSGGSGLVLLNAAEQADLLVVGKRGMGAVSRMLVGSTSIAVAGRSPVPVVVVPDNWVQSAKLSAPLVVGIDRTQRDDAVLDFAFDRARRLKVPLVAVYAWQIPALYTWSPQDIRLWSAKGEDYLAEQLQPWSDRYPSVETVKLAQQANPAMALLDAAEIAQMVVLGRHTGPHHLGGLSFGSTTRGVLHYAECPVAVVPTPPDVKSTTTIHQPGNEPMSLRPGPLY